MTIYLEPAGQEWAVKVATKSQASIFGDFFGFYEVYIRDVFASPHHTLVSPAQPENLCL